MIDYHEVSDSFPDFTYLSTDIEEDDISRSSTNNHDFSAYTHSIKISIGKLDLS